MNIHGDYKTPLSRKLGIIGSLVLLIFCVVVAVQAIWTHGEAIKRGKLIAERLTEIQSDHIELTFNAVDLTLRGVSERQYYNSVFGESVISAEVEGDLKHWVESTPQVSWILMADENGNVPIISSKKDYEEWAGKKSNISNEYFFKIHKKLLPGTTGNNGLEISIEESEDSVNGRQIILSRSIYNFDGTFGGVVAAAVDSNYFFQFFRSIEIGDKITMAMFIKNGRLLLSTPESTQSTANQFGDVFDQLGIRNTGTYDTQNMNKEINGVDYIVSFKNLHKLPVVIVLAFDEAEILSAWRSDRMTDLVFLVLFLVFGIVLFSLVLAMARQIQRAEQSERRALLANQAKMEFLAKMSHELRTPLNAIIGFSEMIDSGYFGPVNNKRQQERVHDINLCGNHLLQLINDILDYSKGEAGKLELRDNEMGVSRVIDESVRMIREKAKTKNIEIDVNIPEKFPRIIADERKIKQILINLLTNAIKFTAKNGKIEVFTRLREDEDIEIVVKDNGIGMAQEDIPVALSVFGQIRAKKQPEDEEGTGLGLPLCKMLTELHGGTFILESELGKGTESIIILPKQRVVKDKEAVKKEG